MIADSDPSHANSGRDHERCVLELAPRPGFEPGTYRLTAGRSTVELSRNIDNGCSCERIEYTLSRCDPSIVFCLFIAIPYVGYSHIGLRLRQFAGQEFG